MQFANGWLSFELGVLQRLRFSSVALPFTGEPNLALHVKRWRIRVAANDPMAWSHTKCTALIENHGEQLSESDLEQVLEEAYVPRREIGNQKQTNGFNAARD